MNIGTCLVVSVDYSSHMLAIRVRELKAHLSHILRDVQAGEDVLVTDRGRVIAELRRPGAVAEASTPVERVLARMAASGHLRVGEPQVKCCRRACPDKAAGAKPTVTEPTDPAVTGSAAPWMSSPFHPPCERALAC